MTTSTVTHIHSRANGREIEPDQAASISILATPVSVDDAQVLSAALIESGLHNDQQAVWNTYPNLKQATLALLAMYSTAWPSIKAPGESAVVNAVKAALERVHNGISGGERDRAHVVANYLAGLATIGEDIASVHAWGYNRKRPVERMHESPEGFCNWSANPEFTEVRFLQHRGVSQIEIQGTQMKLLCAIASTRDVGMYQRYA